MKKITPQEIEDYCIAHSKQPHRQCDEIQSYTKANVEMSQMLIGKLEASLLGFLLKSINAKRVLEIGTYTGYSALAMAEHLPEDGEVITLDINQETVDIGKRYWEVSPHGKKIKSIIAPANQTIETLEGLFDLVFIDAHNTGYSASVKSCLPKLSQNGIIVLDNALWSGSVLEEKGSDDTEALKQINNWVSAQDDLYTTLLPVRDGMMLIRKR